MTLFVENEDTFYNPGAFVAQEELDYVRELLELTRSLEPGIESLGNFLRIVR
jgi:hypothetical protein